MVQLFIPLLATALAFGLDFGAIRVINRLEGSRAEVKADERRSFTIGDKYFLPLAAGFGAFVWQQHADFLSHHLWVLGFALIGLAYGLYEQRQNYRHDLEFGKKVAQWYHALIACPIMVFVIALPLVALIARLDPVWSSLIALSAIIGWFASSLSDIVARRIY